MAARNHVPVVIDFVLGLQLDGRENFFVFSEDGWVVDVATSAEVGEGLATAIAAAVADVVTAIGDCVSGERGRWEM